MRWNCLWESLHQQQDQSAVLQIVFRLASDQQQNLVLHIVRDVLEHFNKEILLGTEGRRIVDNTQCGG